MSKKSKDYFLRRHPFFFSSFGDPFDQTVHDYALEVGDPPQLPLPDYEEPRDPCEVPIPLQHNIRYAHESGVKKEHLAMIYGYPLAWIELFCVAPDAPAN